MPRRSRPKTVRDEAGNRASRKSSPGGEADGPAERFLHDPPPGIARALARLLVSKLPIGADDLVVELCCGAGALARAIEREVPFRHQILAVDASVQGLARLHERNDPAIRTLLMDPWEFAEFPVSYDVIVMKDALDSIADLAGFFAKIRERLMKGGRLALVQTAAAAGGELFKEAQRRAEIQDLDPQRALGALQVAGFRVKRSAVQRRQTLSWAQYLELLGRRYLPVLGSFADAELHAGIESMRARRAPQESIELRHSFELLSGSC